MKTPLRVMSLPLLLSLAGCASFDAPPSPDMLATLPIVSYPSPPPAGDHVYRLPAGKPIELRLLVDGDLLADSVDNTVSAQLRHDLYLHRKWASEDGKHWKPAEQLVATQLAVRLPSYETPGPGEIHLAVRRRAPQ